MGSYIPRKTCVGAHLSVDNLRSSESILELISSAVFIFQGDNINYVNGSAQSITGYSKNELLDMHFPAIIHEDFQELAKQQVRVGQTGEDMPDYCEVKIIHKDGKNRWVKFRANMFKLNGKSAVLGLFDDITERKQAEDALHNLATTFSAMSGKVFFSNVTSHLARMLDIDYAFIGELVGDSDRINIVGGYAKGKEMELPFTYDLAGTPCKNVMGQSLCIYSSCVQEQFPDDALLEDMNVEGYVGSPLFDSSGHALGLIVLMHGKPIETSDAAEALFKIYTDRVSVEIERRQADSLSRKLSSAIDQAGVSILITDSEGVIEYVNQAFTELTGYTSEEAVGQTPKILKSGAHDISFHDAMWKTISSGETWHDKVFDRKKDGEFFPAMLTIAPIFNGDETITHFVGTHSDLSQLEDMEHQFYQAQKMDGIGTFVGGIAHDFNNMLAGIMGNIYMAKKDAKQLPDVVKRLARIEGASLRAADMISQLLTFARKGVVSMEEISLVSFVKKTLKFLRASIPEDITLHKDICSESLQINGDITQLHQVLMNLLNNARDAVEGVNNPCISITIEAFHTDDAFMENHAHFEAGAYARLSMTDNGCGIPKNQIERLFEPFFTTKRQGKGTGLGLAMVFGAIKTHHGFIHVDSTEGEGTTFHVYLPLLEVKTIAPVVSLEHEAVMGHGELILVVDDEQFVRETIVEVLIATGYRVLQATDGLEATGVFNTNQEDIAIALLDVVMPRMGGVQLAECLREMKPDVPIIFMTGYDKDAVLASDEQIPNSKVLTKPVQLELLSHRIRQLLDGLPGVSPE